MINRSQSKEKRGREVFSKCQFPMVTWSPVRGGSTRIVTTIVNHILCKVIISRGYPEPSYHGFFMHILYFLTSWLILLGKMVRFAKWDTVYINREFIISSESHPHPPGHVCNCSCTFATHLLHPLQRLVESVTDAGQESDVPPDLCPRVTLCSQVQESEAVEDQPRHDPREPPLNLLLGAVPLAAHLDVRLAVEHAQLMTYDVTLQVTHKLQIIIH